MDQQLFANGITVGEHLIVADNETGILKAITYQLQNHNILIITGGLGPTSDDLTRFALAKYLQTPLLFNEEWWRNICQRLQKRHLKIHENNRQQCLFPEGGILLPNEYGTAAGCFVEHKQQQIFMLPGPPKKCLAMFSEYVLLRLTHLFQPHYRLKWLLAGVSESEIAAKIEAAIPHLNCHFGYRLNYPDLEFKLSACDAATLEQAKKEILPIVQDYLVNDAL
ncbi:MAG: competence/damage-inducible protein A [Gammaproteobacteria bacterium]|nr:competence/damage-inducible protein A [Gammaproteobacteria bacterium]